jgi:hypothetical protein
MEIYHVYTMDADSSAKRTIIITLDLDLAKEVERKTLGGCMDIWKDNRRIKSEVV